MSDILKTLGYSKSDLKTLTQQALVGGNGGELYLSKSLVLTVAMENGIVTSSHMGNSSGGSFRRVNGKAADFVAFDSLDKALAESFAKRIQSIPQGQSKAVNLTCLGKASKKPYYYKGNVLAGQAPTDFLKDAVALLEQIDAYARAVDKRVVSVSSSLTALDKEVLIQRFDGKLVQDVRPMCGLSIGVIVADGTMKENGHSSNILPIAVADLFDEERWQGLVQDAVSQAVCNLSAVDIASGKDYDILVANGWGGVLLHEAFGHGLEADFHAKGGAAFQGMIGQRIASKGVNIYDDGTVANARGSLHFDDEGNPTNKTLLVEDGVLVGLMTDEISAAELGMKLTGNARRERFDCVPMPRMTNTYMEGQKGVNVEDQIKSIKKGIYVMQFGGGQVNIYNGEFEFNASVARVIENGKLGDYVKGVSLAGSGKNAFMNVVSIADDMEVSKYGSCGKEGQSVAVTVGQGSTHLSAGAVSVGGKL